MILLDTTVFVDLFRNFKPAVDFFGRIKHDEVLFSAMTETELVAGKHCNDPDYKEKTLHFLNEFRKVIVENKVATLAGDLKRGYGLAVPDAIIAASALITDSALITSNTQDFDKIKELKVQKPY